MSFKKAIISEFWGTLGYLSGVEGATKFLCPPSKGDIASINFEILGTVSPIKNVKCATLGGQIWPSVWLRVNRLKTLTLRGKCSKVVNLQKWQIKVSTKMVDWKWTKNTWLIILLDGNLKKSKYHHKDIVFWYFRGEKSLLKSYLSKRTKPHFPINFCSRYDKWNYEAWGQKFLFSQYLS